MPISQLNSCLTVLQTRYITIPFFLLNLQTLNTPQKYSKYTCDLMQIFIDRMNQSRVFSLLLIFWKNCRICWNQSIWGYFYVRYRISFVICTSVYEIGSLIWLLNTQISISSSLLHRQFQYSRSRHKMHPPTMKWAFFSTYLSISQLGAQSRLRIDSALTTKRGQSYSTLQLTQLQKISKQIWWTSSSFLVASTCRSGFQAQLMRSTTIRLYLPATQLKSSGNSFLNQQLPQKTCNNSSTISPVSQLQQCIIILWRVSRNDTYYSWYGRYFAIWSLRFFRVRLLQIWVTVFVDFLNIRVVTSGGIGYVDAKQNKWSCFQVNDYQGMCHGRWAGSPNPISASVVYSTHQQASKTAYNTRQKPPKVWSPMAATTFGWVSTPIHRLTTSSSNYRNAYLLWVIILKTQPKMVAISYTYSSQLQIDWNSLRVRCWLCWMGDCWQYWMTVSMTTLTLLRVSCWSSPSILNIQYPIISQYSCVQQPTGTRPTIRWNSCTGSTSSTNQILREQEIQVGDCLYCWIRHLSNLKYFFIVVRYRVGRFVGSCRHGSWVIRALRNGDNGQVFMRMFDIVDIGIYYRQCCSSIRNNPILMSQLWIIQ